ncbi:hypothetical protein DdX_20045 [Ditylenchus destructor]|uniref:Uncharacterized protein n=1 Tax=Ditylenchus destructor TaxID=166010 RepID=A0AAD4QTV2_9BILA|nr:hypothetical protein DdX_20045 [Ditylenchus destructor]
MIEGAKAVIASGTGIANFLTNLANNAGEEVKTPSILLVCWFQQQMREVWQKITQEIFDQWLTEPSSNEKRIVEKTLDYMEILEEILGTVKALISLRSITKGEVRDMVLLYERAMTERFQEIVTFVRLTMKMQLFSSNFVRFKEVCRKFYNELHKINLYPD